MTAMAKITHLYRQEFVKATSMGKNCVSVGTSKKIHEEIKKQNLPVNFVYPYNNCKKG
jgi:hypothetical protein